MGEPVSRPSRWWGTALSAKINVFLLASCRLFREALARTLKSKNDVSVVGCAPFWDEAISVVEESGCDVLLVNPANSELCDFALLESIARRVPAARTILIGMVEDEATFLRAVCSGVVGYVLQHASAMDVIGAVRSAHQGEAVCPPRLCRALFQQAARSMGGPAISRATTRSALTRRERQLVPLISSGLTNKEIAAHFNLSEQTVKNHVHRILRRTGATNRFAAVEIACDHKLVSYS